MSQTVCRPGCGFGAAEDGKKYLGMMMIAADFDPCERDHADPGILDLGSDQLGEILLDLVANSAKPGGIFRHPLNR